jgi:hypothetical protein
MGYRPESAIPYYVYALVYIDDIMIERMMNFAPNLVVFLCTSSVSDTLGLALS